MFMKRALTALVALAVFGAALFLLPQSAWAVLLAVVLAIGATEWGALAKFSAAARIAYAGLLVVCAGALYVLPWADVAVFGLSVAFWIFIAPVWLARQWKLRNAFVLGAVGWVALVPMWLALVRLQPTPYRLLLVMSVVWIADTAAYLAGKSFGRVKLAPTISPGKTREGAMGAAAAVVVYYGALVLLISPEQRQFSAAAGLGLFLLIFVLSIVGDLFESWLKRQAGVKDSGQLLPGHGGILDRVDGLTATMPLAALAFQLR